MITDKIKALFQFIEYLYSNIENFNQYNDLIEEVELLDKERKKVSPQSNYKDKLKYDEVQVKIKDKFIIIKDNIIIPITSKATELNIYDFQNNNTSSEVHTDIHKLKENFSNEDLQEIFNHKNKYLEYRTETKGEGYFELGFFFNDFDEVLKGLFDYFKETEHNEFEAFETKTIRVNSIQETAILSSEQFNKSNISDNEFLKGKIIRTFVPQGNDGYFEISKGNEKRKITLKQYFDLCLGNWEQFIDERETIKEKLQAVSNAIFDLQKDEYHNSHIKILSLINKNIRHLENIKNYIEQTEIKELPPPQNKTKTDKLKVPQIALIHVYEGIQITRENSGEIAARHGYTSKNSGEGLFQDYTNYCSAANRKGKPTPCTLKKLKNKIELFESIVNHLSDNNKRRAIDEISILNTILETEYQ